MQVANANDEHNNRNMHQTVWNVGGERVDGHADEQVGGCACGCLARC